MSRTGFAKSGVLLAFAAFALWSAPAYGAFLINFDEKPTGRIITNQYAISPGVTFSGDNYHPGHPDTLTVFKSDRTNTPDLDLEFPWTAGNLVGTHLDKILIVAENVTDFDSNGLIDHPDDEADGGTMFLKFNQPLTSFGVDLIDVELTPALDNIDFYLGGTLLRSISFDQFTNSSSPFYDPTIVWLDRSANRIQPLTAARLGIPAFDEVRFRLPECAAIDNINFDFQVLPEPGAGMMVLLIALPALARRRSGSGT